MGAAEAIERNGREIQEHESLGHVSAKGEEEAVEKERGEGRRRHLMASHGIRSHRTQRRWHLGLPDLRSQKIVVN